MINNSSTVVYFYYCFLSFFTFLLALCPCLCDKGFIYYLFMVTITEHIIFVVLLNLRSLMLFSEVNFPLAYFQFRGPRWQSGNTLASHLCGRGSIPVMAVSGKAGSCLPLVGSLQYTTLANYMYWFPLPFQLPVVI